MQLDAKLSQVQPLGGGGGSRWRRIKDGECWKGVWSGTSNICGCRLSLHSVLQSKAGRWCICREAPVGQPSVCNSPNGSSFLGQMIYPWSAPAFFFFLPLARFQQPLGSGLLNTRLWTCVDHIHHAGNTPLRVTHKCSFFCRPCWNWNTALIPGSKESWSMTAACTLLDRVGKSSLNPSVL